MVDDLVEDAKDDALDITIQPEPVDIARLARQVVEWNQPLAVRKHQTMTVAAPASLIVMCDPDRVQEAIDNLVSNAVKYSPIGAPIDIVVAEHRNDAAIEVRDRGPGLTPHDMSRIFGRFQRLSAKPTAGESSTGLGLSIVKRIVTLHGGRITVESAGPGKGTTFRIALPRITQADAHEVDGSDLDTPPTAADAPPVIPLATQQSTAVRVSPSCEDEAR
jgi:signal transduction histidine kinase